MPTVTGGNAATPASVKRAREAHQEAESKKTPLTLMTMAELRAVAQKQDLVGYGKLNKGELVAAIQAKFAKGD